MKNTKYKIYPFIKGELVDLIVLTKEIVEKTNWFNWFNDQSITENMQQHYYPNNIYLQKKFLIESIKGRTDRIQLGVFHKKDKILIGVVSLNSINRFNRNCEISGVIGEKKYQTLLNFVEAFKNLIKHGFDTLDMNRIYSCSISKDVENLMCRYLKFEREGVLKEHVYKKGSFQDAYLHSILKKNYLIHKIYN